MNFIELKKGVPVKSEQVPNAHLVQTLWSILVKNDLKLDEMEQLNRILHKLTPLGSVLSELVGFIPCLEKWTRTFSFNRFCLTAARSNPIKEFYSFFPNFLHEKKMNRVKGEGQGQLPTDIMDLYLEKVEATKDKFSPFHPSKNSASFFLADLFGAGIHTAHITLLWMLYYMAKNPKVQLKLQEEIDQVIGNGNGLSRLPSLSNRGQMPYADAVVHEVLRMSSAAPLGVPRKTIADVRFHGYTLKKKTMVFANTYGIHYDPEIWGDPQNFRPERWFGDSGQKLKNENFLPFSTGRRICLGEALSREQLFLYVTTLFQKYSVDFKGGKVPKVKGIFVVTLHPSNFTLVFNQRKLVNKFQT